MLIYFKRYKMEFELDHLSDFDLTLPEDIRMIPWQEDLLRNHARVKHESFRNELDAILFPCLGQADGCLKLMNDIRKRGNFIPEATYLAAKVSAQTGALSPIGTIQGLRSAELEGSIQNVGVIPEFRGQGIAKQLLHYSLHGFLSAGCRKVTLEVTTHNTSAIRLYERVGFRTAKTVFKAAEVPGL